MTGTENFSKRPLPIVAAVLFLGSASLLFFGTRVVRQWTADEMDASRKIGAESESDRQKISRIPEFRDQADMIGRDSDATDLFLPEDRVAELIREAESVASEVGGTLVVSDGNDLEAAREAVAKPKTRTRDTIAEENVATSSEEQPGLLDTLPEGKTLGFTFTFVGRYADVMEFLRRLESAPYAMDVVSMDISPVEAGRNGAFSERADVFSSPSRLSSDDTELPEGGVVAAFSVIAYMK
jgi:hypothetical protein